MSSIKGSTHMMALHVTNRTPRHLTGNNKERYLSDNAKYNKKIFYMHLLWWIKWNKLISLSASYTMP
jgi:hypothetical protein